MKKILMSFCAIFVFYAHTSAYAEYNWRGAELMFSAEGSIPLVEEPLAGKSLSWMGSTIAFAIPENSVHMYFAYTGPMWVVTDWFWFAPLLGTGINWMGETAFDASIWMGFSFFEDQFSVFLEGDFLVNHFVEIYDYYGLYCVDYKHSSKLFKLGVHAEQINKGVMFGPHAGILFPDSPLSIDLQYYFGLQDENKGHAMRIKTSFKF